MHAIDNRILISGAYREDDGTAARCIGIIRRGAALYLKTGEDIPTRDGRKDRGPNRRRKTPAESEAIARHCRRHTHMSAAQIAAELGEPVYVVRYVCEKFRIQLRPVLLKGRAA